MNALLSWAFLGFSSEYGGGQRVPKEQGPEMGVMIRPFKNKVLETMLMYVVPRRRGAQSWVAGAVLRELNK